MRHAKARAAGRTCILAAALAVALAPAVLRAQDVTLKSTSTTNGREIQTTQYISPTATRNSTPDGTDIILRLDQQKMYVVQTKQKTYSELTFDEIQKRAAAATTGTEGLPPEAAAQMQKMMGGMGGGMTVNDVGPGETIAGYATEKYHIVMGSAEMDEWMAPAIVLSPMFYDAMMAILPSNPMFDTKKLYGELKKLKGVPMKSVTTMKMMGQVITTTTVVSSVDKSPIPAAAFEVPAGFKLVPMK